MCLLSEPWVNCNAMIILYLPCRLLNLITEIGSWSQVKPPRIVKSKQEPLIIWVLRTIICMPTSIYLFLNNNYLNHCLLLNIDFSRTRKSMCLSRWCCSSAQTCWIWSREGRKAENPSTQPNCLHVKKDPKQLVSGGWKISSWSLPPCSKNTSMTSKISLSILGQSL